MTSASISNAVRILKEGGLIAVPTETVYGLAGDALSPDVVRKIFEVKGRPFIDPLIVHVQDLKKAQELAHFDASSLKLAKKFWPGPMTLVLPKKAIVPDIVTAGLGSVGIRVPKGPIFQEVLKKYGGPLAAPSANPFGYVSPTEAKHVEATIGNSIGCVIDGGPCEIGIESTVLDMTNPESPKLLRPGPISPESVEACIGALLIKGSNIPSEGAQLAPGMLEKHYSPRTKLSLIEPGRMVEAENSAIVRLKRPSGMIKDNEYWLSEDGEIEEIARNLFSLLQKLDANSHSIIYIEQPKNEGLGVAVNDRLRRAAVKR